MYPSRILSSNLKSTQNQIRSGKNLFIFHRQTTNHRLITLAQSVLCIFSHVSCCQDVESQVDLSVHLRILLFLWIIIMGVSLSGVWLGPISGTPWWWSKSILYLSLKFFYAGYPPYSSLLPHHSNPRINFLKCKCFKSVWASPLPPYCLYEFV